MRSIDKIISSDKISENFQSIHMLFDQASFNKNFLSFMNDEIVKKSSGKKKLVIKKNEKIKIETLLMLLNNNKEVHKRKFEPLGINYNVDKGILLMGNVGCGKTEILNSIWKWRGPNHLNIQAKKYTAYDIYDMFSEDKTGWKELFNSSSSLLIDDLGDEPSFKSDYGNYEGPLYRTLKMKLDQIEHMYSPKPKLYITTNENKSSLIERYGERTWDRIVGHCNIITLGSEQDKSFRQ